MFNILVFVWTQSMGFWEKSVFSNECEIVFCQHNHSLGHGDAVSTASTSKHGVLCY